MRNQTKRLNMNKKLIPVAMSLLMMQGMEVMAESRSGRMCQIGMPSCSVQNPIDSTSVVENKVKEIVAKHLKIEKSRIGRESDFAKELGADSLDVVEIVMMVETEFGFELSEDELVSLKKVSDVVAVIENRKKKQQ